MIKKNIFLFVSIILLALPLRAEEKISIADGMRGLSTEKCITMVRKVEKRFLKDLPMRTHPVINKDNPQSNIFSATTILDYNGDDSQVNISAIPTENGCNVIYMETFTRQEPCIISREQIFKKWTFLGKLKETMVFKFRRDDNFFGYLTPQGFNTTCLITKRRVFYKM